jgi:hypothetical protein
MSISGNLLITALEVPAGDAPIYSIVVTRDGVAFDLTGSTIDFYCLREPEDALADALFHKTLSDGISVISLTGGTYMVTLSLANAALITPQSLPFFRSIVTAPDGRPGAVNSGYFIVTP